MLNSVLTQAKKDFPLIKNTTTKVDSNCQISAQNDVEAIACWLREYEHKATTYRTYQKEVERFLLWCMSEKHKCLAELSRDDMQDYIQFLADPAPREKWVGKRTGGIKRGSAAWRPFTGPLSESAKRTAISSIDSMMNYLLQARYLSFNPLVLIKKKYNHKSQKTLSEMNLHERMLSQDEWQMMLKTMRHMPETSEKAINEKARLRFLVSILFLLGLRVNELTTHSWNAFRKIDGLWWFYVLGKGDKPARIPVNDALLKEMIRYRQVLKKTPYPAATDDHAIIASFINGKAISARQINKILKDLALRTAQQFKGDIDTINKLKKFSAHWLRHMSASMQDQAGIQFKHIRANHRHENDETTRKYVHAIDHDRHHEMQRLEMQF